MKMRSIHRILDVVLFAGAAALSCSSPVLAQEVPSVDAIERMAQVLTELDPGIKALEMRSYLVPFEAGKTVRHFFRYASPDQYILFQGLAEDQAAYMAAAENQTVIYDARRGSLLLVQGTIPNISIQTQGPNLMANWGISNAKKTSEEPSTTLLVDFPSFLRHPNVLAREVESLGGGKYRLTHTTESGSRMIATVDSLSPFAYTGLEVHAKGIKRLALELRVNQPLATSGFSLPPVKSLRARFRVEQMPAPEDMKSMMRILRMAFLPLGFGAGPENREIRDFLDKMFSEKHDWRAMEARYKRDLPKLRELLPMPQ